MDGKFSIHRFYKRGGKITVATGIFALLAIAALSTVGIMSSRVSAAGANGTASTAVRVLNTPPQYYAGPFGAHAFETPASATNTPSLNNTTVTWSADAYDTGNDSMWLLICDNNGAPTASSSTAPTCAGGATHNIAVSSSSLAFTYTGSNYATVTAASVIATSSETMAWYAFLCDNNSGLPLCSPAADQGLAGDPTASPIVIHHPYNFTVISNNSPQIPTSAITFVSTAAESPVDVIRGGDKATLYICKSTNFAGGACTDGTWATTTVPVTNNPQATTTLTVPWKWGPYPAYAFIQDSLGFVATGVAQGATTTFTVSNVAPVVSSSTINYTTSTGTPPSTLALTNPLGLTPGFNLTFQATDNNGCTTQAAAQEVTGYQIQLFPTGSSTSCQRDSATYNPNYCYNSTVSTTTWGLSCSQTSCNVGTGNSTWDCSFPLWSNTDPTATSTPWFGGGANNWDARVSSIDSLGASTSAMTAAPGQRPMVLPLNYLDLASTTIGYGAFQPGQGNASTSAVLGILSEGNTALNINAQSSDMCPGFVSTSTGCAGTENNNTIYASRQHYSLSSTTPYGTATSSSSTTPQFVPVAIPKPTATGTATQGNMYWGIFVPATITTSGDYKGLNTIYSVMQANTALW